jgi:hypothetical protein
MTGLRMVRCVVLVAIALGVFRALCYPAGPFAWGVTFESLAALAYALSLPLCWKIAADFDRRSLMGIAWRLMAASAAVAILRHAFEVLIWLTGWLKTDYRTIVSLRQIPIVASLVLLSAALACMWMSFHRVGLRPRWRVPDGMVILLILAFVPDVFLHRASLADANSVWPLFRHMQSASPFLLAIPAVLTIPLYRICQDMGGGLLAHSLRSLVVFLVVRVAALWISVVPQPAGPVRLAGLVAAFITPWFFLLAVAERWQFTVSTMDLARRYEADGDFEILTLTAASATARKIH